MPKFYCEYCDIYLTHSSPVGRRQHNHGRKHVSAKIEYFQNLIREEGITPQNFLLFLNPRNYNNPLDPSFGGHMNNCEMNSMYMKYNDMRNGPYSYRNMPPYNGSNSFGVPSNKYIRAGHLAPVTPKYVNPKYVKGQSSNFNTQQNGPYSPNPPVNAPFPGASYSNNSYNNNVPYMNARPYNQTYPYSFQPNNNNNTTTNYNPALNMPCTNNKNESTNQRPEESGQLSSIHKPNDGGNESIGCSNESIKNAEMDTNKEVGKEGADVNKKGIQASKKNAVEEKKEIKSNLDGKRKEKET